MKLQQTTWKTRVLAAGGCLSALCGPAWSAQSVTVNTSSWSPNPAYVGDTISSSASGSDSQAPAAQSEHTVKPHWHYSTAGVYISSTGQSGTFTPYTGNYVIGWNPTNNDDTQSGVKFNGIFWSPGFYIVKVNATVVYHDDTTNQDLATNTGVGYLAGDAGDLASGSTPHAVTANATGTVTAHDTSTGNKGVDVKSPTTVTFAQSSYKTGWISDSTDPKGQIKTQVSAKVSPATEAPNVQFTASSEFTINGDRNNAADGTVTFTITGSSATPAGSPNGDAYISAKSNGKEVAKATVIVIVPAGFAKPHQVFPTTSVQGKTIELNVKTSPYNASVDATHAQLGFWYGFRETITVVDQFGKSGDISALYAGCSVKEQAAKDAVIANMNVTLSSSATYMDPVGVLKPFTFDNKDHTGITDTVDLNDPNDKKFGDDFVSGALGVMRDISGGVDSEDITVLIGGHSLSITGRTLTYTTSHYVSGNIHTSDMRLDWP